MSEFLSLIEDHTGSRSLIKTLQCTALLESRQTQETPTRALLARVTLPALQPRVRLLRLRKNIKAPQARSATPTATNTTASNMTSP